MLVERGIGIEVDLREPREYFGREGTRWIHDRRLGDVATRIGKFDDPIGNAPPRRQASLITSAVSTGAARATDSAQSSARA